MRQSLFIVLFLLAYALPVSAQGAGPTLVIGDTGHAQWVASPAHNATFGTPPVAQLTSYLARLYLRAAVTCTAPQTCTEPATAPVLSYDWGKGTPDASNQITGPAFKTLAPAVQANQEYILFLHATGPGGTGTGWPASVPFGFPAPPAPATSPVSIIP